MARRSASFVLAIVAVLTSLAAGTALASTINASPAGSVTATSLGTIAFRGGGGAIEVICRVTLRGSINGSISNEARASVGSITEGRASECTNGTVAFLLEARSPWPLTLAEPARDESTKVFNINAGGVKVEAVTLGLRCLYEETLPLQVEARGEDEAATTGLLRILRNTARRISGGILCPETAEVSGEFSLTRQTLQMNDWTVSSMTSEDGNGHTVINATITRRNNAVNITSLGNPTLWTITGLNCVRNFNVGDSCSFTATSQNGAGVSTKTLRDANNAVRLSLRLAP